MLAFFKIVAIILVTASVFFIIAALCATMIISGRISRLEEKWAIEKHSS